MEDAIKAHQRPKLERYGDVIFLVLKTARYIDPSERRSSSARSSCSSGDDFVVSVRHGEASALHGRAREARGRSRSCSRGPGAVSTRSSTTSSTPTPRRMDGLERRHRGGRAGGLLRARSNPAERIYELKREAIDFSAPRRRSSSRSSGSARATTTGDPRGARLLPRRARPPDAGPRAARGLPRAAHERPGGEPRPGRRAPERGHAKISAWVAIVAVPTMIAGIYGMNFDHMPELGWSSATRPCWC